MDLQTIEREALAELDRAVGSPGLAAASFGSVPEAN